MVSAAHKKIIFRLSNIQILLVDNDAKIIELITKILKNLGFSNIYEAKDGFEGFKLLTTQKFDLIITDWELRPQGVVSEMLADSNDRSLIIPKDGASFVRAARASKHSLNPYLSIIMLVGVALKENIEYARDSGVNEVVVKPITAESLCERIATTIDRQCVFVTSSTYRGPCRRRRQVPNFGHPERRKHDIRIIPFNG